VFPEVSDVLTAVRSYLSQRFPLVSQGSTVLSGYVCCFLLYGQASGHQVFGWPALVGGVSAVLLTLIRRIVDDVEDLRADILAGRASSVGGGRPYLRGLLLGAAAVTVVVGALNASCSLGLLALSMGVASWLPVATVLKHTAAAQSWRSLLYLINESCPFAGLLYTYAAWHQTSGTSLPAIAILAIAGLFWTLWQFWVFTRKVGFEGWPPWGLTLDQTRYTLIAFLVLAAVFSILIDHSAKLRTGYLIYCVSLSSVFAAVILRWWTRLPALDPNRVVASWAGLPFAVAVEIGVLLAILASSL
jgi:hypothetical protein